MAEDLRRDEQDDATSPPERPARLAVAINLAVLPLAVWMFSNAFQLGAAPLAAGWVLMAVVNAFVIVHWVEWLVLSGREGST